MFQDDHALDCITVCEDQNRWTMEDLNCYSGAFGIAIFENRQFIKWYDGSDMQTQE